MSRFPVLVPVLALLAACAPQAGSVAEPVALTAEGAAAACAASPRVGAGGPLIWGPPDAEFSLPAPYDLACPEVRFTHDGRAVTVRAPTLAAAVAHLLSYYADLRVRVPEPGVVTADDPAEVPGALPRPLSREGRSPPCASTRRRC